MDGILLYALDETEIPCCLYLQPLLGPFRKTGAYTREPEQIEDEVKFLHLCLREKFS